MRSVYLPISGSRMDIQGKADVLNELRRSGADRVVLVASHHFFAEPDYGTELENVRDAIAFMKGNGYEPVIWLGSTIGHGGALSHDVNSGIKLPGFTRFVTSEGQSFEDTFCPLDPDFADLVCKWVKDLISLGAKTLLLDDDFRLSCRGAGFGCLCVRHMAEFQKRINEPVTREELVKKIYSGAPNRYRRVFRRLTGETLENFARQIRAAADELDPSVRIGLCVTPSGWDLDGTDGITLARLLAGTTRPLLRLSGAPYWAKIGSDRLGEVISYERLQAHWCRGTDIELLTEGDSYPRDRHRVPAAYLEGFDMALSADGQNGILKYMQLYVSSPRQERGYIDFHLRNRPVYEFIDRWFSDKQTVGVTVYEPMHKLENACFKNGFAPSWIPAPLKFANACGIPVSFEKGLYPVLVFGEAARSLPEEALENGAVLDADAAVILTERGVDVGIKSVKPAPQSAMEYFPDDDDYMPLQGNAELYEIAQAEGCITDTWFETECGRVPGALRYQNAQEQRFLIYPFSAERSLGAQRLFRSYSRKRQLIKGIEWLCGLKIPAYCASQPDTYLICREKDGTLAVGLMNFCEDRMLAPEIELDARYEIIETCGCKAECKGNTLTLSDIPAFEGAFLALKKIPGER